MKNVSNNKIIFLLLAVLAIGLAIGYYIGKDDHSGHSHELATDSNGNTVWTCSMHPQIKMNVPGKCALCGMDLIPLDDDNANEHPQAIQLGENALKLASISTMTIGAGETRRKIRLNGKISFDERKNITQSAHIPGRMEQLAVNFTGDKVQKGQLLATVYSPELVSAQQELIYASSKRDVMPELYEAAIAKMKNWKLSDKQIAQITATGRPIETFSIFADVSGIVTKKNVANGDYVEQGAPLFEIADLQQLWLLFDLYESDVASVNVGDSVRFTVAAHSGKTFKGKVVFIDPVINASTRVASARVEVGNSEGLLKPEMFATGDVLAKTMGGSMGVVLPKSAIMWTGVRSVVYVKLPNTDGRHLFQMREVTLGPTTADGYQITDGLEIGEEVVINGTFTVDAAAQLAGKPSMMNKPVNQPSVPIIMLNAQELSEIAPLFDAYFNLKNALAFDNLSDAKTSFEHFMAKAQILNSSKFSDEMEEIWGNSASKIASIQQQKPDVNQIKELRKAFLVISKEMVSLALSTKGLGQTIYLQHCPMANSNKGADWLSTNEEIENPYYGASMFSCGEVVKTLK